MVTVEQQLLRWGVTGSGRYADELREVLSAERQRGRYHGGGSFGPKYMEMTSEERAKSWLAMIWDQNRNYCHEVKVVDPIFQWRYDMRYGKRSLEIHWEDIPAKIGDIARMLWSDLRVFWDRRVLGIVNPYV